MRSKAAHYSSQQSDEIRMVEPRHYDIGSDPPHQNNEAHKDSRQSGKAA
jgi:hypothetical protein